MHVGIDLGMTTISIPFLDEDTPRIIPNRFGAFSTFSVVAFHGEQGLPVDTDPLKYMLMTRGRPTVSEESSGLLKRIIIPRVAEPVRERGGPGLHLARLLREAGNVARRNDRFIDNDLRDHIDDIMTIAHASRKQRPRIGLCKPAEGTLRRGPSGGTVAGMRNRDGFRGIIMQGMQAEASSVRRKSLQMFKQFSH